MRRATQVSARFAAQFLALAAVTLAVAAPARAQGDSGSFVMPFSALFISTGKLLMDVSKLNTRFERPDLLLASPPQRTGFQTISNDGYSVGIGAYTPVGRVLLGGEWHYSDLGQESSPEGKTNRLQTNYAMATVGYAAFTGWRFTLSPFLGVGYGAVSLTLRDRNGVDIAPLTKDPLFDEIVLSHADERQISGSYLMLQPGLGFDYLALRSDQQHFGLVLGLRFSSAIAPNRTTWKYAGHTVFGGPDVAPSGTMLRLVFGIGGFRLAK